ncbi:MAG: hypothetical protein JO113_08120 [Candidatus Eremiobacteraeota bacterium]|nr:hypothetical protein [Candidatus Eremiobacteraeota bacterium]
MEVLVGYAADAGGGVAYARLTGPHCSDLLRFDFRSSCPAAHADHAAAYAALTAVARALAKRKIRNASFVIADAQFVDEIVTGRNVSEAYAIPYVRLRCALNALAAFSVRVGSVDDLAQRARAEVALNVAA